MLSALTATKSIIDVVCFDGNGYTDEWKKEAKKRGLDVETNVPKMFKSFTTPKAIELFTKLGVYSEKELEARNEVKWETYTKKVQIEGRVIGRMAINHIIPAALAYGNQPYHSRCTCLSDQTAQEHHRHEGGVCRQLLGYGRRKHGSGYQHIGTCYRSASAG